MIINTFNISGNCIRIGNPDWDFIAKASIKSDYVDELQSLTWSKKGKYLYNNKLKMYLHVYVMRKWYGDELYEKMKSEDYVIDHIDNNGYNCCIDNLWFLNSNENKAKGLTLDKLSADRRYMALSIYKDFDTQLFQITIVFNYPAKLETMGENAVVELAYLLYDCEYEIVINDARLMLYDYRMGYMFRPSKLSFVDYHIEGTYGKVYPVEIYEEYLSGKHGHTVAYFVKKAPLRGWSKANKEEFFYLSGETRKKDGK